MIDVERQIAQLLSKVDNFRGKVVMRCR